MKLDTVIDDIVESYQKHNDISKVDTIRQPDKTIIIDILERLQDIIFPGFFGRKGLKSDYVKYYLGDQIQIIYNDLKNQILLAFDYCENCKDACKEEEARDKTLAFLKTIPQIREYLLQMHKQHLMAIQPLFLFQKSYFLIQDIMQLWSIVLLMNYIN